MGSPTSPKTARHHVSPSMCCGFAYSTGYTLTPALPFTGIGYPPASPHRLTTTSRGPPLAPRKSEDLPKGRGVSTTGFIMGASSRVREYQPVVHRLRLSASP